MLSFYTIMIERLNSEINEWRKMIWRNEQREDLLEQLK